MRTRPRCFPTSLVSALARPAIFSTKSVRLYAFLFWSLSLDVQRLMFARSQGGTVISRKAMAPDADGILTGRIFMNASAFFRLDYDFVKKAAPNELETALGPDVLDSTRIHNEDYEIARKMASDAMEQDEEDLAALDHPSDVVNQLMEEDSRKLDDLSLDDFAVELQKIIGVPKRLTLYLIRDELHAPFSEKRGDFKPPTPIEVFTMLTGESRQTLDLGLIIPVRVVNNTRKDGSVLVRLDSGVDGVIPAGYLADAADGVNIEHARSRLPVGQTVQAMVTDIQHPNFHVELSVQPSALRESDAVRRQVQTDTYFNLTQANMDRESADSRKKRGSGRARRIIKHPNFYNFNSGQAEQHLANAQRGDCVIRPSSRGTDHLAVTWKVDDGIYQHLGG
jgi:transcription elongation factor SPT6